MARLGSLFAAVICVSFLGCSMGIPGSGVSDSETRKVDPFEKISLGGIGELNVSMGAEQSVTITTDDNLLEYVETSVENGQLVIRESQSIKPKMGLVIDVVIPAIRAVDISGAARLNLNDIEADMLKIDVSGASTVVGSGTAKGLNLDVSGACNANLESLTAEKVTVDASGACKATVHASNSINADASGVSKITCHGNPPKVTKDTSGMSKVTIIE